MEIDKERRQAVRKAYLALIGQHLNTLGYIKTMDMLSNELVVIKYRHENPPEVIEHLRTVAREFQSACPEGTSVVLCPTPFDIKSLPREDAKAWLRELAKGIGCEVIDAQEPIEFPQMSPEDAAEMIERIKALPNHGHIEPPRQATAEETAMFEHFRQLGKEKAQKVNDIAMKALQG